MRAAPAILIDRPAAAHPSTDMDLENRKRALRRQIGTLKAQVTPSIAKSAGIRAAELIGAAPEFASARQVALFASLPDEPSTLALFGAVIATGKRALLPRILDSSALDYARVESWEDLRPGPLGILEPATHCPTVAPDESDLVIVPGVAFDRRARRLGRGGGYYDRLFPATAASAPTLFGFGFAFQLVEGVPCGPRDRILDAVVTERGIVRVRRVARARVERNVSGKGGRERSGGSGAKRDRDDGR